ncbi:nucleolar protein 12 [Rhypophila sp. PSN 637]
MGKTKALSAPAKAVDPSLAALFTESVGPAKPLPKTRYSAPPPPKPQEPRASDDESDDEELSELSDAELEDDDDDEEASNPEEENTSGSEEELSALEDDDNDVSEDDDAGTPLVHESLVSAMEAQKEPRKRKRKQRDEHEDLESAYFQKLADEDEPSGKRIKGTDDKPASVGDAASDDDDESMDDTPVHESLAANPAETELEKANRTVFLGNVSSEAITSKKAKKTLLNHMSSVLDKEAEPKQKVESIRFRSTAFSTAGKPKKVAAITQELMESTTKSTNAYVVYSTPAAARVAASKLNGTVVLDRHLRVDSVAHPAPVDHRRCVFIGNLGMVDDETVINKKTDEEGNEVIEKRKRFKNPMDVEEGLWRIFGKLAGKVESVRVVRDPVTRVGQGIAYVQFYDGIAVEKAIVLDGKKFPPMLPRALRVNRCKAPHKTKRALEAKQKAEVKPGSKKNTTYVPKPTSEDQTLAGRASKLLGRSGAAQLRHKDRSGRFGGGDRKEGRSEHRPRPDRDGQQEKPTMKSPEDIIFEGRRASAKDGKPKDLKFKGSKNNKSVKKVSKRNMKPAGRGAVRAAKWRAEGKAPKP